MSKNKELFKERITKTHYSSLILSLYVALDDGSEALKRLLFGNTTLDTYEKHGTYAEGQHTNCAGLSGTAYTEKRLCKCLYYYNSANSKECESCQFANRYKVSGNYLIEDYEVPAYYYGDGIGEIDLVITDGIDHYATEVKPAKDEFDPADKGNQETLLRMIAEILTYTYGYPVGKYKPAIAFFEGTAQEAEYLHLPYEMKELIKKAQIAVFRFEKDGKKAYKICKL